MKKPSIEKTIRTATELLIKSVDEKVIRKCLIRDGFSEHQSKVMMLWAKQGEKNKWMQLKIQVM